MFRVSRSLAFVFVIATVVAGCNMERSHSAIGPTSPTSSASGQVSSQPSFLGTWRSVVINPVSLTFDATVNVDPHKCGVFQWTVTSQSSTEIAGQLSANCQCIPVSATANGRLTGPSAVTISVDGSGTLPGTGPCTFSVAATGTLEDSDTLRLTYTGTSCLGPMSGQETLRRNELFPDPPTTPDQEPEPPTTPPTTPPSTPDPTPPSTSKDEIDISSVTVVLGASLKTWTVTSAITEAYHSGTDLCTYHTRAGKWPAMSWFGTDTLVEGNQWMFAKINGRWYAGAGEWLRPGQECKNVDGHIGQGAFGGTIMENWTPAPGEMVGVAVSTPARAGQWGLAERSNVVLIRW